MARPSRGANGSRRKRNDHPAKASHVVVAIHDAGLRGGRGSEKRHEARDDSRGEARKRSWQCHQCTDYGEKSATWRRQDRPAVTRSDSMFQAQKTLRLCAQKSAQTAHDAGQWRVSGQRLQPHSRSARASQCLESLRARRGSRHLLLARNDFALSPDGALSKKRPTAMYVSRNLMYFCQTQPRCSLSFLVSFLLESRRSW